MIALYCDRVIDGLGHVSEAPTVVLLDEARIADVLPQSRYLDTADEEVRLDGLTVMPGLVDLHVHLTGLPGQDWRAQAFISPALRAARATNDLRLLLEAGFTTVRDCGSTISLALRDAVEEGSVAGPRIVAAGRFIEPTGGVDDAGTFLPLELARQGLGPAAPRLADGPDEVRKAVREQVRAGADFIKTCADGLAFPTSLIGRGALEWTNAELHALVDEAHRLGRRVAIHALTPAAAHQAIDCGADTIEHGFFLDEPVLDRVAQAGIYFVPTLAKLEMIALRGEQHGLSNWLVRGAREAMDGHRTVVQNAHRMRVPIALGSDCSGSAVYPFGENTREIEALVQAGLSTMEAIVASTSVAAQACGLQSTGAVAPGFEADLIAVPGNPLDDITALRQASFVMRHGEAVASTRAKPLDPERLMAPPWTM